jgi:hypothetical protein
MGRIALDVLNFLENLFVVEFQQLIEAILSTLVQIVVNHSSVIISRN